MTIAPVRPATRTTSLVVTPAVFAHRGASGYRPEHTLEAYRTAIRMGADGIELDLVPTRDGVLIARHENELSRTSDVADHPEYADRLTTKVVAGEECTGWFSEDFTLAEIKTLAARERMTELRPANRLHDGREGIATFNEVLAMVQAEGVRRGRTVSVLVELKVPSYFAAQGVPIEDSLLSELRRHGADHARSTVTIMSFEPDILRALAPRTKLPIVQLLDRDADVGPGALDDIETYADGIGAHTELVLPRSPDGSLDAPTRLVRDAHRRWLSVYVWTLRAENHFLAREHRIGDDPAGLGDMAAEAAAYLDAGVDGLVTDHPDIAVPTIESVA